MDIDYTVGEVELSYKPKFKNIYKVTVLWNWRRKYCFPCHLHQKSPAGNLYRHQFCRLHSLTCLS